MAHTLVVVGGRGRDTSFKADLNSGIGTPGREQIYIYIQHAKQKQESRSMQRAAEGRKFFCLKWKMDFNIPFSIYFGISCANELNLLMLFSFEIRH